MKTDLRRKLAEKLGLSGSEMDAAYDIFREKAVEVLEFYEALRVTGVGTFQLRSKLGGATGDHETLVYVPEDPGELPSGKAYYSIDLPGGAADTEFGEDIFRLGIKKESPIRSDAGDMIYKSVSRRVEELISAAEPLDSYDLWKERADTFTGSAEQKEDAPLQEEEDLPQEVPFPDEDEPELTEDDLEELEELTDTDSIEDTDKKDDVDPEDLDFGLAEAGITPDEDEESSAGKEDEETGEDQMEAPTEKEEEGIFFEDDEDNEFDADFVPDDLEGEQTPAETKEENEDEPEDRNKEFISDNDIVEAPPIEDDDENPFAGFDENDSGFFEFSEDDETPFGTTEKNLPPEEDLDEEDTGEETQEEEAGWDWSEDDEPEPEEVMEEQDEIRDEAPVEELDEYEEEDIETSEDEPEEEEGDLKETGFEDVPSEEELESADEEGKASWDEIYSDFDFDNGDKKETETGAKKGPVEQETYKSSVESEKDAEGRGFSKSIWVFIGIIIVLVGAGLYYFLYYYDNTATPAEFMKGDTTAAETGNNEAAPVLPDTAVSDDIADLESNEPENETVQTENTSGSGPEINGMYMEPEGLTQVENLIFRGNGKYFVQMHALNTTAQAERAIRNLKQRGITAYIVKAWIGSQNRYFYRIEAGSFDTIEEARQFKRNQGL